MPSNMCGKHDKMKITTSKNLESACLEFLGLWKFQNRIVQDIDIWLPVLFLNHSVIEKNTDQEMVLCRKRDPLLKEAIYFRPDVYLLLSGFNMAIETSWFKLESEGIILSTVWSNTGSSKIDLIHDSYGWG